ncbi:MAG: hypothetical protein HOV81_08820 [Kofleriaceae bacterium]|nr:hypothetical protein [Kofleriaceae bacterium]
MRQRSRRLVPLFAAICACGQAPQPASPAAASTWSIPTGWKHETIPFPLEFAPSLAHRGIEELRFPPGFLDETAPNRWSYTFVWRLDEPAMLDAEALGHELEVYFRGLLAAVDGDKHRLDPAQITASASGTSTPDRFTLSAHVIDTFRSAGPVDLTGWAHRTTCGSGALWTFVLAPEGSPIRMTLDELAAQATCEQAAVR